MVVERHLGMISGVFEFTWAFPWLRQGFYMGRQMGVTLPCKLEFIGVDMVVQRAYLRMYKALPLKGIWA